MFTLVLYSRLEDDRVNSADEYTANISTYTLIFISYGIYEIIYIIIFGKYQFSVYTYHIKFHIILYIGSEMNFQFIPFINTYFHYIQNFI